MGGGGPLLGAGSPGGHPHVPHLTRTSGVSAAGRVTAWGAPCKGGAWQLQEPAAAVGWGVHGLKGGVWGGSARATPRLRAAHLSMQASRLVELPYSSSSDDDSSLAGDTDLPAAEQDPGAWGPVPPKPGTSSQCVRYLAFLWNFLFLLLGLLALAVGVWGLLAKGWLGGERLAPLGSDPMLLFVLVGLGASTVSLAGCLGALRSSPCLLRFFVGAVLTFVGLEVLGGLLLLVARHRLRDALRDALLLCLLRYQEEPDLRFLVDEVQRSLECCGLGSYRDWETNP